jgi:TATA-binding protein-associated factor Taf7
LFTKPNINELECPLCGVATLISDEVKAAFYEVLANPNYSGEEQGEEEQRVETGEEEHSGNDHKESQQEMVVKETTEGEEEEMANETNENQSHEGQDQDRHSSAEQENSRGVSASYDFMLNFPCSEHSEEYCTHYSPILKKLYCPSCILDLQARGVEHNAKPIRKCYA